MLERKQHDEVSEIKINRPPVNALTLELIEALEEAVSEAGRTARAIVLSGNPGMFSAGLDVPSLLALNKQDTERFVRSFFGLMETVARSPVPIASALTGHSPAGGTVIVLFSDYRVMSRGRYRMGLNEVQVGLIVPVPIQAALSRLIGAHRAERLVVAGQLISPEQAFEVGLVDQLEDDPEATVQAALDWCRKHVALPREAMLATRKIARADLTSVFDGFGDEDIRRFVAGWYDPHTQAGLRKLVERLGK